MSTQLNSENQLKTRGVVFSINLSRRNEENQRIFYSDLYVGSLFHLQFHYLTTILLAISTEYIL